MNTIMNTIDTASVDRRLINETFIANAAQFGNVRAAYLPASSLFVDNDTYQRKPQRTINQIAKEFDDDKCGFLEVAYRKDIGMFAIIDGQNRFTAGKMAGRDRFACHILTDISVKQEALKFASQDENKTLVSTYDKFRAELFAQKPDALQLKRICDKYGITVTYASNFKSGTLKAIAQAKRIIKIGGEQALIWIFDVIKESGWHNLRNAYSDAMLRSLYNIYSVTEIDDHEHIKYELTRYFKRVDPDRLLVQALSAFYNSGKTGALTRLMSELVLSHETVTLLHE